MMMTLDHIRAAMRLPDFDGPAAQSNMAPNLRPPTPPAGGPPPRRAGVLLLLYPTTNAGWQIVLTRRTETVGGHKGQISFPGGRRDEGDPSYVATALRETCEELGLCNRGITVEGEMARIYIPPSNYMVYPVVGSLTREPDFVPSPHEVAEVFSLPVRDLLNDHIKGSETRYFQGMPFHVPYYTVNGYKVWGATAAMLCEFEHRLRHVREMA